MLGREVEKRAFKAKVQCFVENSAKKSLGRRQPYFHGCTFVCIANVTLKFLKYPSR